MEFRPFYSRRGVARTILFCAIAFIVAIVLPLKIQAANLADSSFSDMEKPDDHIATALSCDQCHLNPANDNFEFVHGPSVQEQCYRCHNGSTAEGKPSEHLPTKANCISCHKKPGGNWSSVSMNHSVVSPNCISCHNGQTAPGKPANHISAPNTCNDCHSTRAFKPAQMDHTTISASCITCHNGQTAPGKPANQPIT